MSEQPTVIAGGIVCNRAWCLEDHLRAVGHALTVARCYNKLFYVTGSNSDDTPLVLERMGAAFFSHPEDEHKERPHYSSIRMGELRNRWAEMALWKWPNTTHLWVVDSDVIPAPDCLKRLLEVDKPVVGAWVPGCTPAEGWDDSAKQARRTGLEHRHNEPFPATMLGGCYLIRCDALAAGIGWGYHAQGEDAEMADTCRAAGIGMWAQPLARCEHRMKRPA